MTVVSFVGADTAAAGPPRRERGHRRARPSRSPPPAPGSWVWGAGSDWDKATARTVGPNQTKVNEYLAPAGDTFWVQRQNARSRRPPGRA